MRKDRYNERHKANSLPRVLRPQQLHNPLYRKMNPHFLPCVTVGNLSKPRRRRQRERRQTNGLMSRRVAVLVRYKSLYISLPFSAKQQREMTKFCVFGKT